MLPPPSCSLRRPGPRPSLPSMRSARCRSPLLRQRSALIRDPLIFGDTRRCSRQDQSATPVRSLPVPRFCSCRSGPSHSSRRAPSVKPSDLLRSSSQRTPPISICTVRQNQPCRDENHLTAHVRPAAFFSWYKIGSRPDARPSTMMIGLKVKASLFP